MPAAIRVRATDLRDLARRTCEARSEHPEAVVLIDVYVMIAEDFRTAHQKFSTAGGLVREQTETLLYVGTPAGLASLLSDIRVLGIADGAFLLPAVAGYRVSA